MSLVKSKDWNVKNKRLSFLHVPTTR